MSLEVIENERSALSVLELCDAFGVPRATYYRAQLAPPERVTVPVLRRVPRKLSDADRAAVLAVLHEERFVDQPPAEIVATLLSEGVYLASERTYYRLLAELAEVRERRSQRRHPPPERPSLVARGPNEVWTWDITKLAGPAKGVFYYAYVMIDLFSRFVVGWLVATRETGALAAQWLKEIIAARAVDAARLKVHNDCGAPMTSVPFTQLLERLGITSSLSRPRVSDDNPYSEAHFKTLKYQPDYPDRFGSKLHAEAYIEEFMTWYNEVHHHAGLALFTPGEVYRGEVEVVAQRRQDAMDRAYQAHPERFVRGAPRVRRPPAEVSINPLLSAAEMSPDPTPTNALGRDSNVPTVPARVDREEARAAVPDSPRGPDESSNNGDGSGCQSPPPIAPPRTVSPGALSDRAPNAKTREPKRSRDDSMRSAQVGTLAGLAAATSSKAVGSDVATARRGSVRRGSPPSGTPKGPRGAAAVDGPQRNAISGSDTQNPSIEVEQGRPSPLPERTKPASGTKRRKAHE